MAYHEAMAHSRGVAGADPDGFYPTPMIGTEALLMVETFRGAIWEPACGDGAMVRAIVEYGAPVWGSDVHDYGCGYPVHDFLQPYIPEAIMPCPEWIITNPPFLSGGTIPPPRTIQGS